jgi:T4-like virus tail tube protein gp19
MSQPLYDWLAESLKNEQTRQNGAVVAYDYNLKEAWRLNFFNAFVSEAGFPALDASSKDAATLCIKLAPEYTRRVTAGTGKAAAVGSSSQKGNQRWLLSNFRLAIDGINCDRVNRIEAITVTQQLTQSTVGTKRDYQRLPSYPLLSNLVVTLADDSNAADFYDWQQSFVIEGNSGQNQEKSGTLELLSSDLKNVLFTLQFKGLGIFRLAPLPAGTEAISRIQAEMYCEQVLFMTGSAAATTTVQPGTTSSTQITLPANQGLVGVAARGIQTQTPPKTRVVSVSQLPVKVSVGSVTPSQGPRNLAPLQRQPVIPRAPTLRFRNLSSTAEIT